MKLDGYEYQVTAAGRVNLIGEHVDYCGGKVLPAALSLKSTVLLRPNGTNRINLSWTDLPDRVSLEIGKLGEYRSLKHAKYQAGCAYVWQRAGHNIVGCDMLFDCTVPFGSGLSSSASIEVATIAALATAAGEELDRKEIALAAQKAENEYVGVNCGIMDQFISANGKSGCAVLLDCKTLDFEYVPVRLEGCQIVITNCNKPHDLVTSKYNERRQETELALSLLKKQTDVSCLADLTPAQLERFGSVLPEVVKKRASHVVGECDRVRLAAEAMRAGDAVRLGELLNQSHASLRDLYEVTGKELDALVAAAQAHPACVGSRMTGAGFGGCTISIVRKDGVNDFRKYVSERYEKETGYPATFYETDLSDGITVKRLQK